MAKSKSGLSPKQRQRALHDLGFTFARTGKGSHTAWEHGDLKLLARKHSLTPPANLRGAYAQSPWEITVPDDPASGTWENIIKYAKWCQQQVIEIKASSEHDSRRVEVASQFRTAASRSQHAKKAPRFEAKTGIPKPSPV